MSEQDDFNKSLEYWLEDGRPKYGVVTYGAKELAEAAASGVTLTEFLTARLNAAEKTMANSMPLFTGPPRFWVGLWRRFCMKVFGHA